MAEEPAPEGRPEVKTGTKKKNHLAIYVVSAVIGAYLAPDANHALLIRHAASGRPPAASKEVAAPTRRSSVDGLGRSVRRREPQVPASLPQS